MVARTSHEINRRPPGQFIMPPDATFEDGLSEDEAIATALSNNATFQSTLTQLGMAHGDLVQAGLLQNPLLSTFLPVGVKQWEWTLYMPMEAFVLRPHKLKIANSDYQNMAKQLVQNGLTLVRDVRVAYADLGLANEQWRLGLETAEIRQNISDLTQKQLNRGDISELQALTARVDALNAKANAAFLEQNVAVARARLAQLMGLPPCEDVLEPVFNQPPLLRELDTCQLIDEALATRPDVQAANWAAEAAQARVELSKWIFLRFDTVADSNAKGQKGFEVGPGLRFEIPIFNRNQGGVMRSEAELEQALYNRDAIENLLVQEIRTAMAQYLQAKSNYTILKEQVVPALKEALHIAEQGYAHGGTSFLQVLQSTSQYIDAKSRMLDQLAALRRARAELERSVGRQLGDESQPAPAPWEEALPEPVEDLAPAPLEAPPLLDPEEDTE